MTTDELVQRVRDAISDYGDVEATASATLTEDVAIIDDTITVDDGTVFDTGDWLYCNWEAMEVKSAPTTQAQNIVEIRRAMRGTVAAVHKAGDVMRSNVRFSNVRILRALNGALAGAYPMLFKIVTDVSMSTVDGQQLYTLDSPVRDIRSIWIETGVGSGGYQVSRAAVPLTADSFMLYGSWGNGLGVKVIAINTFDRLAIQQLNDAVPPVLVPGTLDSDFPDNDEAYDYLVKDATGRLMLDLAATEATNEMSQSRGSQQAQDTRYVLINAAKALRTDARESLRKARMHTPVKVSPRPDARYF
jgi:hypothetical protein